MAIDFVLLDVEGTTTAKSFVFDVLFPYARRHLAAFVATHREDPRVCEALEQARQTMLDEGAGPLDDAAVVEGLRRWIDEDRKHTALKALQGHLWRDGYESGAYRAHLYPDVLPAFERWRAAGVQIAIYSSGSVGAQRLLFAHTEAGDVTGYLEAYFDTRVGHKREVTSYTAIAAALGCAPSRVIFLSDVTEELDAAREAGLQVLHVVRPGTEASSRYPSASDFTKVLA